MSLRLVRFVVVMLAALSLSFGLGHLMQLPARMAWDQYLWVGSTVQGGLYSLSGPLGALIEVTTLIALIVLALLLRRHQASGFALTVIAAVLFATGLLFWWILVYPVNVELAKWVNGPGAGELDRMAVHLGMGAGRERGSAASRLRRAGGFAVGTAAPLIP